MFSLSPAELGWTTRRTPDAPASGLVPARVACGHRDPYTVLGSGPPRLARVSGRFRHTTRGPEAFPAVGDWVALDADAAIIHRVLTRDTEIARVDPQTGGRQVLAANVGVAFVVTSATRELNARRLERFVALARGGGADCAVVLNKADLVDDIGPALAEVRAAVGGEAPVAVVSARDGSGLDALATWLSPGRTVALLGASGVGKSTLANALLGADVQATAPIRAIDDRGRHTTVRRELLVLPSGALLLDTPGLKLPRLGAGGDGSALGGVFADVDTLAADCAYADCAHAGEPGCAVAAAVCDGRLDPARLDALRTLQREQRWAEERETATGRAARKARERMLQRSMRRYYRDR